ncbi:MAG: c-type cytochrome, partial [Planctomycetes bacterium]|nr:c-type cytochrome [Planctomycetota bacterium]
YLTAVSDSWQPIAKPDDVEGDVERGRAMFKAVGCLACHGNIAEFGEEWITKDIAHREKIDEETANHRYLGMTYEQRVHYAMEHFTSEVDTIFDPEADRFDPEQAYNKPTFSRFAPDLSGIGSKVSFEWLYSWIVEPTHYAPDTKMPSLRLTPGEAADIVAYLMTLTNGDFEQHTFDLTGSRRGMVDDLVFMLLSAQRSERRSRSIMKDEGGELGGILVELLAASFGRDRVTGVVDKTRGRERAASLIDPMSVEDLKLMYLGNKMIAHYGCYTCHEIRGFETTTPVGTELTAWAEKPVSQLDFAFYDHAFHDMRHEKPEIFDYVYPRDADLLNHWSPVDDDAHEQISQTHAGFAKHKLMNPRIWDREKLKKPYDKLKMPNYYFTEREAEALTTYLLSRLPPRVNEVLKVDYENGALGPIAKGRHLARELNCMGCHEIEDNAPTIQQYFRRTIAGELEFDIINAPPSLWGEGAKLQHNWFHKFLQQVEPLRPWLQVRMPTFTLTGDDATTLVEYFAALSRNDSAKLAEARRPVREYIAEAVPTDDGSPAGADWYEQESLERRADVMVRFAVERKLMRAFELDALTAGTDELREAHADLLDKVDFMRYLYDVEYPFVEPARPMMPRKDFEHAGRLLIDMGCLQCHVLGAMLPGPARNTDDFVQMYRLDSVRGEGDDAMAIINGEVYTIGSVIDSHTLTGAENIVSDFGD